MNIEREEDALEKVLRHVEEDDETNKDKNENEHLDQPDGEDDDAEDVHFKKISKIYIKDGTRQAYNSSNCLFLLWLNSKKPQSVSDHARKVSWSLY